jgi:hypothetical protein
MSQGSPNKTPLVKSDHEVDKNKNLQKEINHLP